MFQNEQNRSMKQEIRGSTALGENEINWKDSNAMYPDGGFGYMGTYIYQNSLNYM